MRDFEYDVCTIGGGGHVGLPLSLLIASRGKKTCIYDVDITNRDRIAQGIMPFREEGAQALLQKTLQEGAFTVLKNPDMISKSEIVIIVIGTPVDEFLNPRIGDIKRFFDSYMDYFVDGQLIILRSTIYPGTTEHIHQWFIKSGKKVDLAFCPERIAEGQAIPEMTQLPQIVSACTPEGEKRAKEFFSLLTPEIVLLNPQEAELGKLFINAWRYIQFSIANQFFMIANDQKLDYYKIHEAITYHYPRTQGLPKAGFTAGPCLFKDVMQLSSFYNNNFLLGHTAMLINEGFPDYLVQKLKNRMSLANKTVGILGMAFKGGSDDKRGSLSYKLKKILEFECQKVLCTDPYIVHPDFVSFSEIVEQSDLLILATPHEQYREVSFFSKPVIDIWNFYGSQGWKPI